MAECIKQQIESGKKSICDSCFHQKVCKGIGNQPCTKCSHYQDAADVAPVCHGRWECSYDYGLTACSACGWNIEEYVVDYAYCPHCGAKMDLKDV